MTLVCVYLSIVALLLACECDTSSSMATDNSERRLRCGASCQALHMELSLPNCDAEATHSAGAYTHPLGVMSLGVRRHFKEYVLVLVLELKHFKECVDGAKAGIKVDFRGRVRTRCSSCSAVSASGRWSQSTPTRSTRIPFADCFMTHLQVNAVPQRLTCSERGLLDMVQSFCDLGIARGSPAVQEVDGFVFCGLVTLNPPRLGVSEAVRMMRLSGV